MPLLKGITADWYYEPSTSLSPFLREDIPSPVGEALFKRGIRSEAQLKAYLHPTWEVLENPFYLPDIEAALACLHEAIRDHIPIYIVTDYDVDGTTAAALLGDFLTRVGHARYHLHIPNRFTEGYGVSDAAIRKAIQGGYGLFIAADCGTKEGEKLKELHRRGIPILILDHHAVGEDPYPPAKAFINPQRPDSSYPNRFLSAAGVVFKVLQAYILRYGLPEAWLEGWLQLVAISLLADVMPLVGENRALVELGLRQMRHRPRAGLAALMPLAGIHESSRIFSRQVVYKLIPRLNAPGRLKDAQYTLYLLLQDQPSPTLEKVAVYMDQLNTYRRQVQKKMMDEVLIQLNQTYSTPSLTSLSVPPARVVVGRTWNKGIIGLLAAKLVELFYRPAAVLTYSENGELVGSARGPAQVPLYDLLNEYCRPFFLRFGGHDKAAGFTMEAKHLEAFKEAFISASVKYADVRKKDFIDAHLDLREYSIDQIAEWSERMEPIGPGNESIRLLLHGVRVAHVEKEKILLEYAGSWYEARSNLSVEQLRQCAYTPLPIVITPRRSPGGKLQLKLRDVILED
ncbi:MAG: DHHA1 domain-containing protein [Bacteroidia bacterium]|nr:DHHA1 domain-containing protein [Bacteroidia bacterium]